MPVPGACRKIGVSGATLFNWRKKCGCLGPSELRSLEQLEEVRRRGARECLATDVSAAVRSEDGMAVLESRLRRNRRLPRARIKSLVAGKQLRALILYGTIHYEGLCNRVETMQEVTDKVLSEDTGRIRRQISRRAVYVTTSVVCALALADGC